MFRVSDLSLSCETIPAGSGTILASLTRRLLSRLLHDDEVPPLGHVDLVDPVVAKMRAYINLAYCVHDDNDDDADDYFNL
jgi:hypothetical protein